MNKIDNRYQFINNYLKNWDSSNFNNLVLDAGAGERRIKKIFKNNNYLSQDFGEYKNGLHSTPPDYKNTWSKKWNSDKCDIISDITAIPLEDNSIDLITCLEVIEHLPEPIRAFKELSRIVKKNGLIIISCPNLCIPHQEPFFFYSGFSKQIFTDFITDNCNLEIVNYLEEGDFITGHFDQLNALSISSNSIFIRSLIRGSIKIFQYFLTFLIKITKTKIPNSCSGYVIIYKKIGN